MKLAACKSMKKITVVSDGDCPGKIFRETKITMICIKYGVNIELEKLLHLLSHLHLQRLLFFCPVSVRLSHFFCYTFVVIFLIKLFFDKDLACDTSAPEQSVHNKYDNELFFSPR